MRLDRGPGSSLGDTLLAVSLKALTTDMPSAELMTPALGCEPLCANQVARTTLLVIMPTLDDVDIAPVQRGDQSRGVVIPRLGGPGGTAGGHDHEGVPAGGGPAGSRSGASAGGQGGAADGSSAMALGKGKQTRVILDDDEVSSDEDEPLQKQLRQLSGAGPMAVADKGVADKRAAEEAVVKRAAEEATTKQAAEEAAAKTAAEEAMAKRSTEERATKEAAVKAAAGEEATAKRATEERAAEEAAVKAAAAEAAGAAGGSPAPVRRRQRSGPRGLQL
jgi:hypothetical protein